MVHLAWPRLANYRDFFHVGRNSILRFLAAAVAAGTRQLIVAGTCLEYGMQHGLNENMKTKPCTPYVFATDALRRALELLEKEYPFTLQWMRLLRN
ncbi:NAD-dependent epimerase/dehydratase family protein [Bradyrhizobium sp. BWA-3-5]|uniref:NAD-dependent epimerase/dehydratase family protein n=1 Tax=Bradyrhizobium sp. BWA-3-5 TaxID=3080013 RepID=UPI00397B66A8